MSKLATIVETADGQVQVMTKSRWMYVFSMPHTGIMAYPPSGADFSRGIFIKWTNDEPPVLQEMHETIVRLVKQVGTSGMTEIADSVKMTEQMWKLTGGSGSGIQEMATEAAQAGVPFPMPANTLKYLKGFQ